MIKALASGFGGVMLFPSQLVKAVGAAVLPPPPEPDPVLAEMLARPPLDEMLQLELLLAG
jgi:hypothetical protein